MRIIFLDIDGVLNSTKFLRLHRGTICPDCCRQLSRIVTVTGAVVVVSSTWRSFIGTGMYSPRAFAHMLHTHGAHGINIIDTLPKTSAIFEQHLSRGRMIADWLHKRGGIESYVALDDEDDDIRKHDVPLVLTSELRGLTMRRASEAIRILKGKV